MPRISSSQSSVSRFISIVRLALVTSVTWTPPSGPPVSCQITQVSMLPNSTSPLSALARTPSTLSRIHLIFGPEKYVASGRPVLARKRSWPAVGGQLVADLVRPRVLPDDRVVDWLVRSSRSQTTVVSRWLVMPTAASRREMPDLARAPASTTSCVRSQISHRVVLDPARLRIDLLVLLLVDRDDLPAVVEDHEARAGRSLVDRSCVLSHRYTSYLIVIRAAQVSAAVLTSSWDDVAPGSWCPALRSPR